MSFVDKPAFIEQPFANNGDKTTIPNITVATGRASYDAGFPPETRVPFAAGGVAPDGTDFNGIFYQGGTVFDMYTQAGGTYPLNTNILSVGGYPKNAIVVEDSGLYRSLVADNTDNFITDPSSIGVTWKFESITVPNATETVRGIDYLGMGQKISETIIDDVAEVVFTGLDDGSSHKFVFENVNPITDDKILRCLVSADGGSTYKNSYLFANKLISSADTEQREASAAATSINICGANNNYRMGSTSDEGYSGEMTLYNPSDITALKKILWTSTYTASTAALITMIGSAQDTTTSKIDALKFFMETGNLNTGKIIHYKYK